MKLLLTGGAGFIGSNFVRYWLKQHPDSTVYNLDKLTYAGNLDNLAEIETLSNYRFIKGDICESKLVEEILDTPIDVVVNFAAESHVDRSIADAREFIRTNVQGTYTLLDAARRRGVSLFVQVSTDEVYGSLRPGELAHEDYPWKPNNPYSASKASAELLVKSFYHTYHFPALVTRCSNNYGPYQFPEKLIPLMITNALEDKPLPVYGDGLYERDWIFVEDHCRALDQVLRAGKPGEIYNIGSGQPLANLHVVRTLLRILGKPEDLIQFVEDRPGHDRRYGLDTAKIRRELDWTPTVGLEQGLKLTVEWYRAHPEWSRKTRSGEYLAYYERFVKNRQSLPAQR